MNDYKGHSAAGLEKAHREASGSPVKGERRSSGGGGGFIVFLAIVAMVLYGAVTYLPGILLGDQYSGEGQVIQMVNPSGDNAENDQLYANINKDNADANLTNSRAQQRRLSMPLGFVLMLALFGTIIFIIGTIGKSVKP